MSAPCMEFPYPEDIVLCSGGGGGGGGEYE